MWLSLDNVPWRFYEASPLKNIPALESHWYRVERRLKTPDKRGRRWLVLVPGHQVSDEQVPCLRSTGENKNHVMKL